MCYNSRHNGRGKMLHAQHETMAPLFLSSTYVTSMRHPAYYTDCRPPYSYNVEFQNPYIRPRLDPMSSFQQLRCGPSASYVPNNAPVSTHQVFRSRPLSHQDTPPPPPPCSNIKQSWPSYSSSSSNAVSPQTYPILYCTKDSHVSNMTSSDFSKTTYEPIKTSSTQHINSSPSHFRLGYHINDNNIMETDALHVVEPLAHPHVFKTCENFLEEGEVTDLKVCARNTEEVPIDQISSVSDEDEDDDAKDFNNIQRPNINGQHLGYTPSFPYDPSKSELDESRYLFWVNRVQVRLVGPGSSDPMTSTLTNNVVVFKLSNLDFSSSSPLLDEFAHFFLPRYRRSLDKTRESKLHLAEVYLIQSHLVAQSLHVILTSLTSALFIPTTLHLGSNSHLGSEGMTVLATFISKSKEPLRWLALSKCYVTLSAFQKVLDALLSRMDIYPRIHNGESVPIWLDLPNFIPHENSPLENTVTSALMTLEMFDYLDRIRPKLYCQILDRIACGINRCGTAGSFFHIPKLNSLTKNSSSAWMSKPILQKTSHFESSLQQNAELSEIDSDDDKDHSLNYTQASSATPIQGSVSINTSQKSHSNDVLHQTLCLAYQSLLRDAFLSLAFMAAEHHIFPSHFLKDLSCLYLQGQDPSEIPLPVLWEAFPKTILRQQLKIGEYPFLSENAEVQGFSRKRHRVVTEENGTGMETSATDSVSSSLMDSTVNSSSKARLSRSISSPKQLQKETSLQLTPLSKRKMQNRLNCEQQDSPESFNRSDQQSPSEEGEIQDTILKPRI